MLEGSVGMKDPSVDPSIEEHKEEIDKVEDAAKGSLELIDADILETQKTELREFSEKVEEDIKYLESIQEDVCTTEHGVDWRNVITGQQENTPAEA